MFLILLFDVSYSSQLEAQINHRLLSLGDFGGIGNIRKLAQQPLLKFMFFKRSRDYDCVTNFHPVQPGVLFSPDVSVLSQQFAPHALNSCFMFPE
jgi:hypothetical protein